LKNKLCAKWLYLLLGNILLAILQGAPIILENKSKSDFNTNNLTFFVFLSLSHENFEVADGDYSIIDMPFDNNYYQ
jgi:hypothetical protein